MLKLDVVWNYFSCITSQLLRLMSINTDYWVHSKKRCLAVLCSPSLFEEMSIYQVGFFCCTGTVSAGWCSWRQPVEYPWFFSGTQGMTARPGLTVGGWERTMSTLPQLRGLGDCCKLPQWSPDWSPGSLKVSCVLVALNSLSWHLKLTHPGLWSDHWDSSLHQPSLNTS